MADKSFLSHIDLNKNELKNALIHKVDTMPSGPKSGQLVYWNGTTGTYTKDKLYIYDGSAWKIVGSDVYNASLSLQANGITKTTFTANDSTNRTFNIANGTATTGNGTISVGDAAVSVYGLGTAAYTDSTIYAKLADGTADAPQQFTGYNQFLNTLVVGNKNSRGKGTLKLIGSDGAMPAYGEIRSYYDEGPTISFTQNKLTLTAGAYDSAAPENIVLKGAERSSYDSTIIFQPYISGSYKYYKFDGSNGGTSSSPAIIATKGDIPTSFTLTDNILDGSANKYSPYASDTATSAWVWTDANAGKLYLGTVNPTKTTRLNYNGYLYATKLYSGSNPVATFTGTELTADTIILGNGSSAVKTSSKTITTTLGTDDATVPTSKAAKTYIDAQDDKLSDRIDNISTLGRYLTGWNMGTGAPTSKPLEDSYTLATGDYFIITNVPSTGTLYKPDQTGTWITSEPFAKTTVSGTFKAGGIWKYNGSEWEYQEAGSIVGLQPFTNSTIGGIKGKASDGYVEADGDGYGKVNGWGNVVKTTASNQHVLNNIHFDAGITIGNQGTGTVGLSAQGLTINSIDGKDVIINGTFIPKNGDLATVDYVDGELNHKLDKVETTTANPQAYVKTAAGTQSMINIGFQPDYIPVYGADSSLKVANSTDLLAAVNKQYVDTNLSGKQNTIPQTGSTTVPVYFSAAGTVAACSQYAGGTAVTLNGSNEGTKSIAIYAPSASGTAGQFLVSGGSGKTPVWTNLPDPSYKELSLTFDGGSSTGEWSEVIKTTAPIQVVNSNHEQVECKIVYSYTDSKLSGATITMNGPTGSTGPQGYKALCIMASSVA